MPTRHDGPRYSNHYTGFRVVRTVASQAEPAVALGIVPERGAAANTDGGGAVAMHRPEDGRLADMADAASLALRILHRESDDLLPDADRLADISSELADALSRLKTTYPAFARFRVRPRVFGMLAVQFTDEFAPVIRDVSQAAAHVRGDRSAALRTGHERFDELNEKMGLRHIDFWRGDPSIVQGRATLHLHESTHLDAAAELYSSTVDVIESASNAGVVVGGASDIEAEPTAKGWRIWIFNRWGDCPSGCIHEETFVFVAEGETVERVHREGSPESPANGTW